jgi:hypothetical protein
MKTVTLIGTRITYLKYIPVGDKRMSDLPVQRNPNKPHFSDDDERGKGGGTLCECTVEIMEANLCFFLTFPMSIQ